MAIAYLTQFLTVPLAESAINFATSRGYPPVAPATGQMHGQDSQPIIQILPERLCLDQIDQVFVGHADTTRTSVLIGCVPPTRLISPS